MKSYSEGKYNMKAADNIIRLGDYKQKFSQDDVYNKCQDKWINIKRACDPAKTIVAEAVLYIAAIEFLFLKNPHEVIFDSELLVKKFAKSSKQRSRYLKQLDDLYSISYHSKYTYNNKTYRCIFSCKRTVNSIEILNDPKGFYSRQALDKSDLVAAQNYLGNRTNLSSTYRDIDEGREELEELSIRVHSNSLREYVRAEDTSNDLLAAYNTAASHFPVIQAVEASKQASDLINKAFSTFPNPEREGVLYTDVIQPLTAKQEYEHYKNHQNKTQIITSEATPIGASILSLVATFTPKAELLANTHRNGAGFQPETKNLLATGNYESRIGFGVPEKTEAKISFESTQPKVKERLYDQNEELQKALAEKVEQDSIWQECLYKVAASMSDIYCPLIGKMRKVTIQDIQRDFSNMSYKVDREQKQINLQIRPTEFWISWFNENYLTKFKNAAAERNYSFKLVRTFGEK